MLFIEKSCIWWILVIFYFIIGLDLKIIWKEFKDIKDGLYVIFYSIYFFLVMGW